MQTKTKKSIVNPCSPSWQKFLARQLLHNTTGEVRDKIISNAQLPNGISYPATSVEINPLVNKTTEWAAEIDRPMHCKMRCSPEN